MATFVSSKLWHERLYERLELPFWIGTITIGFLPFLVLLLLSYYVARLWGDLFTTGIIFIAPFALVVVIFSHFAGRYIRRKVERLTEYADQLREDNSRTDVSPLYGFRGVVITYVLLNAVVQPVFVFSALPTQYSLLQRILVSVPFGYWTIFISSFFWVWAYSMYRVYRIGKLPLRLRPFAEDRTLGLKPFGRAVLQLTAMYLAFISLIVLPQAPLGLLSGPLLIFVVSLVLLGLVIFFLPLASFHAKLVTAKEEALNWITPQYIELIKQLELNGVRSMEERFSNELVVIDKIQRDIQQIHSWPFDVGIITRLVAIIFSVIAIILAKELQGILNIK